MRWVTSGHGDCARPADGGVARDGVRGSGALTDPAAPPPRPGRVGASDP
ncbi:hypothetical protein ACFSM7_10355 [Clavibacter michiganensis subsp. tessellarius]